MPWLQELAHALQQRGWMLATAESCTGGLIAATCTDLPGSSAWCGMSEPQIVAMYTAFTGLMSIVAILSLL